MKLDLKDAAGIERAAALVYEAVTGKCWHDDLFYISGTLVNCRKCDEVINISVHRHVNPPLAASLDAWRPLWEKMDSNMLWEYSLELANLMTPEHAGLEHSLISFTMGDCAGDQDDTLCLEARFGHHFFRATPPMHLEAALRALGLVEKWEAGE